jgi:hypothetical protein
MTDIWEDWENDDYEVPILQTEEQLKRLEERKLVEESDNLLANELFQNEDLVAKDKIIHAVSQPLHIKKSKHEKNNKQKQQENEKKQKELSKKIKEDKAKKIKEQELFGEVYYDDNYTEYEDKFY